MRFLLIFLLMGGCSATDAPPMDTWLDRPTLIEIGPERVLPQTAISVRGTGFIEPGLGETWLDLRGTSDAGTVERSFRLHVTSSAEATLAVDGSVLSVLSGGFEGMVRVRTVHERAQRSATSMARRAEFLYVERLEPRVQVAAPEALTINGAVELHGDGLLLGGAEGQSWVRLWGCFFEDGTDDCVSIEPTRLAVTAEPSRRHGSFRLAPEAIGLRVGFFRGSLEVENELGSGETLTGNTEMVELRVDPPRLVAVDTDAASLGQYVQGFGSGFLREGEGRLTLIEAAGEFESQSSGRSRSLDLLLVPNVESGELLRYLMSEEDALGRQVNLRREHGVVTGTLTPVIRFGGDELRGMATSVRFEIAPVRQVVVVEFQESFAESLRHFGLRALRREIEARILEAAAIPYQGVNLEFRTDVGDDFALYAHVDMAGPDPNGIGLFGYDNTPGKDHQNLRLYDRIGGVNATTQEDGFPGYGGVFLDSFFAFSTDPGGRADPINGGSPAFDAVFDPFRPDRGGQPVTARDLEEPLPDVAGGRRCPERSDRRLQIACAIWVLGNMVGSTVAHEVGHSLGLADPDGDSFHNRGDEPNRLMDSGGARSFAERATLFGEGPAHFCDDSFEYLQEILPTAEPDPVASRSPCD